MFEISGDPRGRMCVGAYGDQFASQLAIAFQNILVGIGMVQSIFKTAGVQLHSCALFDEQPYDLVKLILIFFIRIKKVFVWSVSDDLIDMAVNIEAGESVQVVDH